MIHRLAGLLVVTIAALGVSTAGAESGAGPAPPAAGAAAAGLKWRLDFDGAKAQAAAEQKMVLLFFHGSDWCAPCIQMEKEVFQTPEFAAFAAKSLVLLDVDFPEDKPLTPEQRRQNVALKQRFNVGGEDWHEGFPSIAVLSPKGYTLLQEKGYFGGGPAPLIGKLRRLKPLW
jgi:thiol:disulfide interchange protein